MRNLHEHLSDIAKKEPERLAILVCDAGGAITEEISRSALLERIEEAVRYLGSAGLKAGDRVALEFENCADLLILSWAAWATGIVTVPLDTKRDTDDLRAFKLQAGGIKLLITREAFAQAKHAAGDIHWMPNFSHEALVLFTSGTTAYPKGAQLTLENLVVNAQGIIEWLRITEDDCFLVQLPLHHINSTTFCLASLLAGASIAIPPRYSNSHFWAQAAGSGATLTSVVPSIIFDQLTRTKEFEAVRSRLKLSRIQLGSAPVVATDALEFMQKFAIPLYQGYGQTETALRVTGVPMDLPPEEYRQLVSENSIGTPMSWATVEIASTEGKILGEGKEGELVVKGPAVMRGYVGGEPAFRDGYFVTGDVGYWKQMSGRRYFFLIGRSKEIIIKGGVNISPIAVENALKKVSPDIDQAYVVGVTDERYGEEVGAVLVWKKNIEEEVALRKLKFSLLVGHDALSEYETPRYFASLHEEELPMTSTAKVQRAILKKTVVKKMDSLYDLLRSDAFQFVVIPPQSPLAEESRALYNHSWQPLTQSAGEYKKYLGQYVTLAALTPDGALAGQVSFSCADTKITCVSICSATFKPKPVPEIKKVPDTETVRAYLLAGNDPVMNFHQKQGAELVEVIPGGRPADKSALGYTMLLRYPPTRHTDLQGPAADQLIQAVCILAHGAGAEVYALSRPGGLASYLTRTV